MKFLHGQAAAFPMYVNCGLPDQLVGFELDPFCTRDDFFTIHASWNPHVSWQTDLGHDLRVSKIKLWKPDSPEMGAPGRHVRARLIEQKEGWAGRGALSAARTVPGRT